MPLVDDEDTCEGQEATALKVVGVVLKAGGYTALRECVGRLLDPKRAETPTRLDRRQDGPR